MDKFAKTFSAPLRDSDAAEHDRPLVVPWRPSSKPQDAESRPREADSCGCGCGCGCIEG